MTHLIESVFLLHRQLKRGRRFRCRDLEELLGASRATVMRVKRFMCQQLGAPIVYDPGQRCYCYQGDRCQAYELPGLWFTTDELIAVSTLAHLLGGLEPGFLRTILLDCRKRIDRLLRDELDTRGVGERIKLVPMSGRKVAERVFRTVAEGLFRRRQVSMLYGAPARKEGDARTVSPQTLVRYRDNWYLDAWCHRANDLRTFALSRMAEVEVTAKRARDIPRRSLERHYAAAYGIFSGKPIGTAVLRFTGNAARYVSTEEWHPRQKMERREDGSCELRVPYSDPRELIRDVLSWGEEAEVLAPRELRAMVGEKLRKASQAYEHEKGNRCIKI